MGCYDRYGCGRYGDDFHRGYRRERREEFFPFVPFPGRGFHRGFREFPRRNDFFIGPHRPF